MLTFCRVVLTPKFAPDACGVVSAASVHKSALPCWCRRRFGALLEFVLFSEQDGLVPCGSYPAEADGRWRRTCYARVDLTGHRAGADVDVLPGGADA
jgi:hypothetical protein